MYLYHLVRKLEEMVVVFVIVVVVFCFVLSGFWVAMLLESVILSPQHFRMFRKEMTVVLHHSEPQLAKVKNLLSETLLRRCGSVRRPKDSRH